jgi:hypothetical protein
MPLSASTLNFPFGRVDPVYGDETNQVHVDIPPNVTIVAGTILGQVTTAANDVQTITISGSPTGGTFTLSNIPTSSGTQSLTGIAYNASSASIQTSLLALVGTGNATVTGSAGGPYTLTWTGAMGNQPVANLTASHALTGGTSPAAAVTKATTGVTAGTWSAYASGNSDGSQTPSLIMTYTVTSDGSGNVYYSTTASSEYGFASRSCPAYRKGAFRTTDLVGLDSNAVTKLGRLLSGTVANGVIQLT